MTIPYWYDLCFKFCKTLCHDYCCEEDLLYSRNISQTGLKFYVLKVWSPITSFSSIKKCKILKSLDDNYLPRQY